MSDKYKCWQAECSEEESTEVRAYSARQAAEIYADVNNSWADGDCEDIMVKADGDDEPKKFRVLLRLRVEVTPL